MDNCIYITKKGKLCGRKHEKGSKYCWQHAKIVKKSPLKKLVEKKIKIDPKAYSPKLMKVNPGLLASVKKDLEKMYPKARAKALKDAKKHQYKLIGNKKDIIKLSLAFMSQAGYTEKQALDEALYRNRDER
jgi:hypothetical protein